MNQLMFIRLSVPPMLRTFKPLLLGLGTLTASGCASMPGQLDLAGRVPWRTERPRVQTESESSSEPELSFRAPRRESTTSASTAADSTFTGHTDYRLAEKNTVASDGAPGDQSRPSDVETPQGFHANGEVIHAQFQSNRQHPDSPVKLQGDISLTSAEASYSPDHDWNQDQGSATNSAASARATRSWQDELDYLIARVDEETAKMTPGTDPALQADYRKRQIQLRLLHLVAHHPEQALVAIPSLDQADQEFWQKMIWAMADSLDANEELTSRERAAQAISRINSALRNLREQADLSIRNASFCEEISYFGNYKRFPKDDFVPGQPVLLYAEIENFRSDPATDSGEYRTLLKSMIEIVGASGQIRWKKNFSATEDLCRNPRRDYFHNYQFTIPERLPLGPHTLKLTVVDELSGKQATTSLKFMVR